MSFILSIARRYLFATDSNGRPAVVPYIGMVGVALGVMVLIVVNAIYAGYGDAIRERLLAQTGHIVVQSNGGQLANLGGIATTIEGAVAGRTSVAAYPVLQRQVLLRRAGAGQSHNEGSLDLSDAMSALFGDVSALEHSQATSDAPQGKDQGAQLSAYHPQALVAKFQLPQTVTDALSRGDLVLGKRLAQSMGVQVGDEIRVIAPPPDPSSDDPELQSAISVSVPVGALAEFGLFVADSGWAVLSYDKASAVLRAADQADKMEVFLGDIDMVETLGPDIQRDLGFAATAYNMKDQVTRQTAYIRQEQQLIALVVGMTLLVASVGIVSGLVMLVHDKRREIAVIRTMGARQRDILLVFLLAGGGIGIIGLFVGIMSGVLIALNANDIRLFLEAVTGAELFPVQFFNVTELPSKLEWPVVAMTALFAIVLVLIAALYPAWRASQVDPALGVKGG